MADVGPGQRGSVVWTAGSEIPDEWLLLGEGRVLTCTREMYEYLPDLTSTNAVRKVPGAITDFSVEVRGVVDLDVNAEFATWASITGTTAAQIVVKFSASRTYTFDAFLTNLVITGNNRDLVRWTATIVYDGASTIVEA